MARRLAETNDGLSNGHMPPASTLAAQIVQNQTHNNDTTQIGDESVFQQLLHEILHNKTAIQETDINVNAQLISVVAEAGLAPLAIDNPLADWEKLRSQALDSIEVIKATVQRQPAVIMTQLSTDAPPLLLRLLASLIALYGRSKVDDLPVADLLNHLMSAMKTSVNLWPKAELVREVIQSCIEGK